jgi:hypothetical protein
MIVVRSLYFWLFALFFRFYFKSAKLADKLMVIIVKNKSKIIVDWVCRAPLVYKMNNQETRATSRSVELANE